MVSRSISIRFVFMVYHGDKIQSFMPARVVVVYIRGDNGCTICFQVVSYL